MAYKKYIKRGGKLYGPYLYESKRVNGKVVSEYQGPKKEVNFKKFGFIFLSVVILAGIIYALSFLDVGNMLTGNVILNTYTEYSEDEFLGGIVSFSLSSGELIPSNSKLVLENGGQRYEYPIENLISEETSEGDFYVFGSNLSGTGKGYGLAGEKMIYPEISFILEVYSPVVQEELNEIVDNSNETTEENLIEENGTNVVSENVSENNLENNGSEVVEENNSENVVVNEEIIVEEVSSEENVVEEPIANVEEIVEAEVTETNAPTETTENSGTIGENVLSNFFLGLYNFFIGLTPTGNVIDSGNSINVIFIEGKTSFEKPFVYRLQNGESAKLKSGSVYYTDTQLSDDSLQIIQNGEEIIVETSYSVLSRGFGEEYLENNKEFLVEMNLSELNLLLNEGELKTSIVYEDIVFVSSLTSLIKGINSTSYNYSNSTELNVTILIPEENATLLNNSNAPSLQIITSETVGLVLTEKEKTLLSETFGDENVKTTSRIFNERLIVKHEIGSYWIENSYEPSSDDLDYEISIDRMKWLKDVAYRLNAAKLQNEQNSEVQIESSPIA